MNLKQIFRLCMCFGFALPFLVQMYPMDGTNAKAISKGCPSCSPASKNYLSQGPTRLSFLNTGEQSPNSQAIDSNDQPDVPLSFTYTGWGADIPIWEGGMVNCFDADYAMDGSMYVAFQAAGETRILIYYSEDHGFTWSKWSEITNPTSGDPQIPANLSRVRILVEEYSQRLFVFHVNPDGYLIEHWSSLSTAAWSSKQISSAPIYLESFDVAYQNQQLHSNLFYAAWLEEYDASHKTLRIYKGLYYLYQWSQVYSLTFSWSTLVGNQVSLAFAPPETVYCSYVVHTENGGTVKLARSVNAGSSWDYISLLPVLMAHRYYDARVAAANVDTSAVWVVHNNVRSGNLDLSVYHYDGTLSVNHYDMAATSSLSEYIADIKYYKGYPNEYINSVYIADDGSYRRAYFSWTSQSDPVNWHDQKQVNDLDVTPWPEGVAPRILYSPGAPTPGGGVVFSYYNRSGLYFDAPWNKMPKLLIITASEFRQAIQPLADWKNQTGITTYVVEWEDLTGTGDTAELIKLKIYQYYKYYGVRYFLLVGDSEKLPVRYTLLGYEQANPYKDEYLEDTLLDWSWCTGGAWDERMASFVPRFWGTDLYYADLVDSYGVFQTWSPGGSSYYGPWFRDVFNPTNIDLVPDVSLGRIPASTIEEVQNYVHKVISYEATADASDWKDKALIITNDERPEWVSYGSSVAGSFEVAGFNTTLVILDSSAGEVADDYIRQAIEQGLGVLLYIGHGAYGIGILEEHWMETNAFPLVAHIGCDAGTFNQNNLAFSPYFNLASTQYCGYANDGHVGCTDMPRQCESLPPVPDPLQPFDVDTGNAEALTVKYINRGGIGYQGANYATQDPGYSIGGWFLLSYAHGRRFMGDMHKDALTKWYNTISITQTPSTYWDTVLGVSVRDWLPPEMYITHTKYNLFGDPTLRVGGILSQFAIPPHQFVFLPLIRR